jgi:hypothetical protein
VLVLADVAGLIGVVELRKELLLLRKVILRVVNQALQQRGDLLLPLVLLLRSDRTM